MANTKIQQNSDDLNAGGNLQRIDDLETFREGLEGKALDEKICKAIEDSTHIQENIAKVVWKTIKEKIVWIILTLLGLLLWDLIKDAISHWLTRT